MKPCGILLEGKCTFKLCSGFHTFRFGTQQIFYYWPIVCTIYNCRIQNSKIYRALSILSLKPKFTPCETRVSLFLNSENAKYYDHTCK